FIPSLILLFISLFTAYIYEDTIFCKYCPSGTLFGLIPYYILNPDTPVSIYFFIHLATLTLVILLTLSIDRFWCRYLCPVGIIYGLMNRLSFLTIKLDKNRCTRCMACTYRCPMNLNVLKDVGKSPGCLLCGECVSTCPFNALKYSISR
ncbi:MAG TPA: 4Fe-4S binding protein, partial [Thermoprotei archaeon]|nr:4Fe-4S binding protein [Thermoprotei archaeon]